MASQVKIKFSRPQQQSLSNRMSAPAAVNKGSPKAAISNTRISTAGLRTSTRLRASQLPVPAPMVNKPPKARMDSRAKNKSKDDKTISNPASTTTPHPISVTQQPGPSTKISSAPSADANAKDSWDQAPSAPTPETYAVADPSSQSPSHPTEAQGQSNNSLINNLSSQNGNSTGANVQTFSASKGTGNESNTSGDVQGNTPGDVQTDLPGSRLPPSDPSDPWHLAFTELKDMGQRISKLDNIERDVASLKKQFEAISGRTKAMEDLVQGHTADVKSLKSSLTGVSSDIERHNADIEALTALTNEVASKADQRIREIKHAIQENIDKIEQLGDIKAEINRVVAVQIKETFQAFKNEIRKEFGEQLRRSSHTTKKEISDVINRNSHDIAYKGLQDQAYYNRHNLVFLGIPEHERDSAFTQALNFCKSSLHVNKPSIDVAYRMGRQPSPDSTYTRPIIVKFSRIADRNSVWMKRNEISQDRRAKPIRIQADIPKQLREDLQILYRVKNAAIQSNQYQTVEVKN